jgi:hypothetical protein
MTGRKYKELSFRAFAVGVNTESKARSLAWKLKFEGKEFQCSCGCDKGYQLQTRPEVKECASCGKQHRLRVGTIFENSKLPLLIWMQALYFMMQDKRGISALQLMRLCGLTRYETAWSLLMRIRSALMERDAKYKLSGIIELDGAFYGHKKNQDGLLPSVFIAVETKKWTDSKGRPQERAGFAQVMLDPHGEETKRGAMEFLAKSAEADTTLVTDGRKMYQKMNHTHRYSKDLQWVNRFISNSKRWILGTHHGVKKGHKYLPFYLAEYTYRFNRRHDPNSLFHRALAACCSQPSPALNGYA